MNDTQNNLDFTRLTRDIKAHGISLGFQSIRVASGKLHDTQERFEAWLQQQYHGEMHYLTRNQDKRANPAALHPGTIRIITVSMNYLTSDTNMQALLNQQDKAYISRYALGRDYHKVMRKRLNQLAKQINMWVGDYGYRAFCDSAPVFERALAEESGLGWIGKNTMLMNREAGSWVFLGELFTTLPLPCDEPIKEHCGKCTACIDICPTQAIVAPYKLDARRCISYLTIEQKGAIPVEFRKAMGNRIYGCDDCQIFCPWNRFAKITTEGDFQPRHQLDNSDLVTLFNWSEEEFLQKTEGSAIRRTGYTGWLRNIAVALGNASTSTEIIHALNKRKDDPSDLVREHVNWALAQHSAI